MTAPHEAANLLPLNITLAGNSVFFGGHKVPLSLSIGLCVLVGPNGSGKSETLRWLRDHLRHKVQIPANRKVVYLAAGRNSVFESFRSKSGVGGPGHVNSEPAAVGHQSWKNHWSQFEGNMGMLFRLKERPDLLLKIEARLQALFQRRLRLDWSQSGLQVGFSSTLGGTPYYANAEASGILELVPLLAAIYDNEIGALLIDEPEISLHPQLQAFLLQEMEAFAGDPVDAAKKLIVFATHSPTILPVRRIKDIPRLVFFTDIQKSPIQISIDAGELKSVKLAALVARLSENHKLAFFSRRVLLVEGPSDEIVVSGLALKLEHRLLGSNTQVVPVTGKGQFNETVKLFRLMGKDVFVLADLDGLGGTERLIPPLSSIRGRPAERFVSSSPTRDVNSGSRATASGSKLLLYRRLHKPRRIVTELAHDLVVIRLFDGHRLQPVFRQPQQPRVRIGHQHRRMRGHHDLANRRLLHPPHQLQELDLARR